MSGTELIANHSRRPDMSQHELKQKNKMYKKNNNNNLSPNACSIPFATEC